MILRYDQGMTTHPEPIDHPLTEAAAVEMWDASPCPEGYEFRGMLTVEQDATLYAMRAAFDAGREHERTTNPAADADRLWEPLNERDLVPVGYEAEVNISGVTRRGVVGRVRGLDVWAIEGGFIGLLGYGTWYVRRPVQELPPERDGVALVPADGHEAITTTDGQEFARLTFTAKRSIWYGPNLAAQPGDFVIQTTSRSRLTPGTWKVDDQ